MARKGWSELSASYRGRLVSGGVTRRQYEAGASLKKARGHSLTPERPLRVVKVAPNRVRVTGAGKGYEDRYETYLRANFPNIVHDTPPPPREPGMREYRDRTAKRAVEYAEAIGDNPQYINVYFDAGWVTTQIAGS